MLLSHYLECTPKLECMERGLCRTSKKVGLVLWSIEMIECHHPENIQRVKTYKYYVLSYMMLQ